jgi:hypothetical protein
MFRFRNALLLGLLASALCGTAAYFLCSYGSIYPLGDVPKTAHILNRDVVRHGIDTIYIFEVLDTELELRDRLIEKWHLRDITHNSNSPMSFLNSDHPTWWPSEWSFATSKFGKVDESAEKYWSIWIDDDKRRIFIEVGQW